MLLKTLKNTRHGSLPGNGYGGVITAIEHPSPGSFNMRYLHGLSKHGLYRKWIEIRKRCYDPKSVSYKYYGANGITVCDEWRYDFKAFYDYVMLLPNAMKPGFSIDRIRNNEGYKPNNIRWADRHTQNTNQRKRKNKTGYTGVYKNGKQYCASIRINWKSIFIGNYHTAKEAAEGRDKYIIDNNLTEYYNSLNFKS